MKTTPCPGFNFLRAFVVMAVFSCLLAGCAGSGGFTLPQQLSFSSSDYYVRSHSNLWAKGSRKSEVVGTVSMGDKVTELKRDKYGWSLVETSGGSAKGWMPSSCLRKSAPSTKAETKATAAKKPAAAAPEPAPTAAPAATTADKPSAPPKEKSESWFSPSSAEAATQPPAAAEPEASPEKEAEPSMFDRF